MVSECLTNVVRHASATRAGIDVWRDGSLLYIRVEDNGSGGADPPRGSGLASLTARARSVDGQLQVSSPPGGPTVVTAELPCGS